MSGRLRGRRTKALIVEGVGRRVRSIMWRGWMDVRGYDRSFASKATSLPDQFSDDNDDDQYHQEVNKGI